MSFTHSQDHLHELCNGWEEIIKFAEEEISRTASQHRIRQLQKLVRLSQRVIKEGWFARPTSTHN
jgi:hypothetical protein